MRVCRTACLLALATMVLCAPAHVSAGERPNIAVVMIDTLRGDLGGAETPNIDRFCREGLSFPNSNSTTPSTRSSIASFMSGVGPAIHGVRHGRTHLNDFRGPLLGELLSAASYHTYGFVANPNIDSAFGHSRGFDEWHELYRTTDRGLRPASSRELITSADEIAELLEGVELKEPYFVYVLAIDPHFPYSPPGDEECVGKEANGSLKCYRREVAHVDSQLPRFEDIFEDATIIFTSDHGEEFGEHGEWRHGNNIYETSTHVPLCLSGHGQGNVTARVGTLDVAATILELAGVDQPPYWVGRNLLQRRIPPRYVMSRWHDQVARRWNEEKSMRRGDERWWFDLEADPAEQSPRDQPVADVDERTKEALEALGYIDTGE